MPFRLSTGSSKWAHQFFLMSWQMVLLLSTLRSKSMALSMACFTMFPANRACFSSNWPRDWLVHWRLQANGIKTCDNYANIHDDELIWSAMVLCSYGMTLKLHVVLRSRHFTHKRGSFGVNRKMVSESRLRIPGFDCVSPFYIIDGLKGRRRLMKSEKSMVSMEIITLSVSILVIINQAPFVSFLSSSDWCTL